MKHSLRHALGRCGGQPEAIEYALALLDPDEPPNVAHLHRPVQHRACASFPR